VRYWKLVNTTKSLLKRYKKRKWFHNFNLLISSNGWSQSGLIASRCVGISRR